MLYSTLLHTFFALGVFLAATISVLIAKYRSNFWYGSSFLADTSFLFQKILLLLANMCFLYFTFYLITPLHYLETRPTLKVLIVLLLMIWCIIGVGLLPFNHTVVVKDTDDVIDESATHDLYICYFIVYKLPLFLILLTLVSYYTYFCLTGIDVFARTVDGKRDYSKIIFGADLLTKTLTDPPTLPTAAMNV